MENGTVPVRSPLLPMGLGGFLLNLQWGVARLLVPRRVVRSRGLRFTVQCDNWITYYRWITYNAKEPETLDWIDTQVQEGDILFDVGTNIGLYAIYAALRHPEARVIAFEPEYANLHLLRDNVTANGLEARVEVYSLALSDRVGVSRLQVQDLTPGSALHTESRESLTETLQSCPVILREGIGATTLDAFCEETGLQPNCLKIDVDGTEPLILEGGIRTIRSPQFRSLIIELPEPQMRERATRRLEEAGLHRLRHRRLP
jgi:FkbM family methyltransferase